MKQTEHQQDFEEVLVSYAEMCYAVAFALTRNPERAEELARYTLTWAWRLRDSTEMQKNTKRKLLKVLRERFLEYYCHASCGAADKTPFSEVPS